MTEKSKGQSLLENAYKLASPADNQTFYNEFAATYDTDFADALGWHYPKAIAAIYRDHATEKDVPVADVGCGTGFVAQALGCSPHNIDGIDISEAMLRKAKDKGHYRSTIKADLTGSLSEITNTYGAVVSAGTFTSGHLGPKPLEALLGIAKPGALFVIGVNKMFFAKAGFEPVINAMHASGRITKPEATEILIYDRTDHDHSQDKAYILCYRKR